MSSFDSTPPLSYRPSGLPRVGKLAAAGAVLAFCVVVFGAFVRISDAGLGCPDWPGCYGGLTAPSGQQAVERATRQFPASPLHIPKARIEMMHRYLAGILGFVCLAIAVIAWRSRGTDRIVPTILLALVLFQALLGMWTVTLLLKPVVVTLHLLGGMATVALLVWLAMSAPHSRRADRPRGAHKLAPLASIGVFILAAQIALGGWVSANYAALACTDFPLCQGEWVPPMDFRQGFQVWRELGVTAEGKPLSIEALSAIHWSHRLGALLTTVYLTGLGIACLRDSALRGVAALIVALVWIQASLGVANVVLRLPVVLAVAHNALAALLLIAVVVLNFNAYRRG